jgi:hypothetical protein
VTPAGELHTAFIGETLEVFAHPFTAGETIAQSRLGVLKVNGKPAQARVMEVLGNGDYILRLTPLEEAA